MEAYLSERYYSESENSECVFVCVCMCACEILIEFWKVDFQKTCNNLHFYQPSCKFSWILTVKFFPSSIVSLKCYLTLTLICVVLTRLKMVFYVGWPFELALLRLAFLCPFPVFVLGCFFPDDLQSSVYIIYVTPLFVVCFAPTNGLFIDFIHGLFCYTKVLHFYIVQYMDGFSYSFSISSLDLHFFCFSLHYICNVLDFLTKIIFGTSTFSLFILNLKL